MKGQFMLETDYCRKSTWLRREIKLLAILLGMVVLLLLIAPYIALPVFLNRHITYLGTATEERPLQAIYKASEFELDENQIFLETEDHLKVWVSEIKVEQPKAVIIYLTGIYQPSITYFYGHAKWMKENGYASMLLEVRGHGQSEGDRITLGYEEVEDVRAVVNYINNQEAYKGVPIVIQGVSMGGAASVNAFGQIPEIDGLIAMSAYSSFEDVILDQMKNYKFPRFIRAMEKPMIKLVLKMMYGSQKVEEMKPIEQIKKANGRPVLLISCTGDTEVPCVSMKRLSEAYPKAQTWLRDSWEHFIVKDYELADVAKDEVYCQKILSFLEEYIISR